MDIMFTGTQKGMTSDQKRGLCDILLTFSYLEHNLRAHFGLDRGSDAQFYHMLLAVCPSAYVIGHPCDIPFKQTKLPCDELREVKKPLDRNHDMADESELVISTPATTYNVLRSGTYAALRYAAKIERDLHIIMPMGGWTDEIMYE